MTKLSFVIPCYNSEKTLPTVVNEIIQTVALHDGYDYEIILINDSSPDCVFDVITRLADQNPKIKGIDLAKNFGQHSAIITGFHYVTGDIVICLDDDGQTPACEAFSLIEAVEAGNDLVFAKYNSKQHSVFRNFGSAVNDRMARWLINKPRKLSLMSYFACRRFVVDEVIRYANPYPYISGLLLRTTNRVTNVPINHRQRTEGHSGYTFKKLLLLWTNGFTAFSVKPLRIATFAGFICSFIGFLYGAFIIVHKLINPATPLGYSSLMAVLLFVGGMIMMMLGMIGEYVGRIYVSLNNAPQYVIRHTVNIGENKDDKDNG